MITGYIEHNDAVIQHFIDDPELAEIMLSDAINDGDINQVRRVWDRIKEAKVRVLALHQNDMLSAAQA